MVKVRTLTASAVAAAAIAGTAAAAVSVSASPRPAPASRATATHVVTVTASEYAFAVSGNARVPAGMVGLRLVNRGAMDHEAVLARLHDGVTLAQFGQALRTSGQAAFGLADFSGGAGTVAAGGTQLTWQALQGGNYVLLCLVSGPDKVPHLMKGMIAGLTVTGHLAPARLAALHPAAHGDGQITAHDMTFTLPARIDGNGLYRFTDTDQADNHELAIVRLNPGVTAADVKAWFQAPAGPPPFTSAGGYGAVPPGGSGWLRLNLPAGAYAAVCFVPDDAAPHAPHGAMGMVVPFTVTR